MSFSFSVQYGESNFGKKFGIILQAFQTGITPAFTLAHPEVAENNPAGIWAAQSALGANVITVYALPANYLQLTFANSASLVIAAL
jgi:hypothetical protein